MVIDGQEVRGDLARIEQVAGSATGLGTRTAFNDDHQLAFWLDFTDADFVRRIYTPGEWSRMTVTAHGGDVEVRVNGTVTARLVQLEGDDQAPSH